MRPEHDFDVIVVGCGPVGAFAGNAFGARGLRCLVIDASAAIHALPRAVHIDHEMMRLFQAVGLAERMEAVMRPAQGHIHIGADGGVIRYMGTVGKPRQHGWANDYFFFQPELDGVLRDGLASRETVTLSLGSTLRTLSQSADGVVATLDTATGPRTVTAAYVVACDGAKSTARKALGIALDDLDFEEPWLVVDAAVDGPIRFPSFDGVPADADLQQLSVMLCDPRRPSTIVPGRGNHRRWEFMLLPGESDQAMMAHDVVQGLIAPWVEGADHAVIRASTYRFHGLVARDWQVGRVFLAGDAAHQTPPFFGQGMCHGLRDIGNLAWKLDLVIRGVADETLLQTYQVERDPQVRSVIATAIEAGRYICQLDPTLAAQRDAQLRQSVGGVAPDLIPPYTAGVVQSGFGQRFIQPWVSDRDGPACLLDDVIGGGFVVLTRAACSGWVPGADVRRVVEAVGMQVLELGSDGIDNPDGTLDRWLDANQANAVLLRPDRYVFGVAGSPEELDTLVTALGERLGLVTSILAQEQTLCIA